MKDPLKQGLKHDVVEQGSVKQILVEVKDPLKQGLKRLSCGLWLVLTSG